MRADYISVATWDILLSMIREPYATALEVALATGMRIGDVVALKPDQVRGDVIEYTAKKTGKRGRAKLPPALAERLRKPMFALGLWTFESVRDPAKHISRGIVWKNLKEAAKRLNLRENVAPHSARKTYAVDLFRKSDLETTRERLQHDRISTTMLYAFADKLAEEHGKPQHDENDLKEFARAVALEVVDLLIAKKFFKKRT